MKSTDKVSALVTQFLDLEDLELAQIVPAPPIIARALLATARTQLPTDPEECDELIHKGIDYLEQLLSDPEPVAGELEPAA